MGARSRDLWSRDDVQFPRLLAEIKAAGLTNDQLQLLKASMDLSSEAIQELFDRAEESWERIKTRGVSP